MVRDQPVRRLSAADVERLARQRFTYAPVGATRGSTYPSGFRRLDRRAEVGRGEADLARAAEALLTWRMHSGAGLRVDASSPRVEEGAVVRCRLGPLRIPCRVVWVLDEPARRGFAYGTLPGHPESGEESFVVALEDDVVTLTVSAYSRPRSAPARLAGPVGLWGQRLMLRRYSDALRAAL
jgi:uncharacterized protein (UPF0548 family)